MPGEQVVHGFGILGALREDEKIQVAAGRIVPAGRAPEYGRSQNTSLRRASDLRQNPLHLREKLGDASPLRVEERKDPVAHEPVLVVQPVEVLGRGRLRRNDPEFREFSENVLRHRPAGAGETRDLSSRDGTGCACEHA